MDANTIAVNILEGIGGRENVASLSYCATRLRFELKDYDKVDDMLVRQAGEVKDTFHTRGQYQIIIGPDTVKLVYDVLAEALTSEDAYPSPNRLLALAILEGVGGQENLVSLAYCATRLRLELNDFDKIDDAKVGRIDGVKGTFITAGQYQIVLGNELVKGVYEQMAALVKQPVSGEKREYSRFKQVAKTLLGKG